MECKEFGFAIFCQIFCHYIYHLSEGEGTIFLQQKSYYIGENRDKAISRLGMDSIQ
jgi:hypothetical protein